MQKKLKVSNPAEIRCQLIRSGESEDTKYYLKYFQSYGNGELRLDNDTVFLPNDIYNLNKEEFRLYYTFSSEDQQVINIYFFDNIGNTFE